MPSRSGYVDQFVTFHDYSNVCTKHFIPRKHASGINLIPKELAQFSACSSRSLLWQKLAYIWRSEKELQGIFGRLSSEEFQ